MKLGSNIFRQSSGGQETAKASWKHLGKTVPVGRQCKDAEEGMGLMCGADESLPGEKLEVYLHVSKIMFMATFMVM